MGGLDTSIIILWLKEHYENAEIYGICVNVGQTEDWDAIIAKEKASGAVDVVVRDVRKEFVEEYYFPMLHSGAVYERKYLLGTSIAWPLQAKCQIEYAQKHGVSLVRYTKSTYTLGMRMCGTPAMKVACYKTHGTVLVVMFLRTMMRQASRFDMMRCRTYPFYKLFNM